MAKDVPGGRAKGDAPKKKAAPRKIGERSTAKRLKGGAPKAKGEPSKGKSGKMVQKSPAEREEAQLQAIIDRNPRAALQALIRNYGPAVLTPAVHCYPLSALYVVATEYQTRIGEDLSAGSNLAAGDYLETGTKLRPAPARILLALARVLGAGMPPDLDALDKDENPHLWARKYLKKRPESIGYAVSMRGREIGIRVHEHERAGPCQEAFPASPSRRTFVRPDFEPCRPRGEDRERSTARGDPRRSRRADRLSR